MLKKIMLALMLVLCSVSFTVEAASWGSSRKQVDLSSKEAVIEHFFVAVSNKDMNLLWNILSPEKQKAAIEEHGSVSAVKNVLRKEIYSDLKEEDLKTIREVLKSDHLRKEFIKEMLADESVSSDFIKLRGKWYWNPADDEDDAKKVDQSSKKALVTTFLKAFFVDQDFEIVWKVLSPKVKDEAIKEEGSKAKAIESLKEAVKGEEIAELRKKLQDKEVFEEFVNNMLSEAGDDAFVQIDGKWYINNLN